MNREILFRIKAVDNTWYYGTPLLTQSEIYGFALSDPKYSRLVPPYIYLSSLGQYTGIIDWNGVRIFEGDIVNAYDLSNGMQSSSVTGVIAYSTNAFCLLTANQVSLEFWTYAEKFEIIGNIHDNPELL